MVSHSRPEPYTNPVYMTRGRTHPFQNRAMDLHEAESTFVICKLALLVSVPFPVSAYLAR